MNIIPAVTISNYDGNKSYDLFSLLLKERIIMITGEINDELASIVIGEIIYLNALSPNEKITMYINSPGGSVSSGLAIYDVMQSVSSPIETIGMGMCASMGAFLLSSGTKGLRKAYPNCEIMIHQPLGGSNGQVSDLEIMTNRFIYLKNKLNQILATNTNQSIEKIIKDTDRNYFMSSKEALNYQLIDEIKTS